MEEKINGLSMEELEAVVLRAVKRAVTEISEDLQKISKKNRTGQGDDPGKKKEPESPIH